MDPSTGPRINTQRIMTLGMISADNQFEGLQKCIAQIVFNE